MQDGFFTADERVDANLLFVRLQSFLLRVTTGDWRVLG